MVDSKFKGSYWSFKSVVLIICIVSVLSLLIIKPYLQVNAQTNSVFFPIGTGTTGFTDVITHQIVRSNTDRVFVFAAKAQYTPVLVGYWTTAAGLPTGTSDFDGTVTVTESGNIISVDAVYNGSSIIHVLINIQNNAQQKATVKDYPFDITTNTFKAPITLAIDGGNVTGGDYIGTSGVSGMVDLSGQLHVSHWTSTKHIIHQAYTYNATNNTLTTVGSSTQVDTAGFANHPSLAVSPYDNSVTIAWVSEANAPTGKILARTRSAAGVWGAVETVSTADAWTSTIAGINIDQGPSLFIDNNGKKYLSYIQDYDSSGGYGRIHVAIFGGSTWQDSAVAIAGTDPVLVINGSAYTHDPALTTNANGQIFILGHGPTQSTGHNMYTMQQNANGTWTVPALFARPTLNADTFDSSASVKWSVVGNNRPNTNEFVFFQAPGGLYSNSQLYYGRFGDNSAVNTETVPLRNYYTTATPNLTWSRITWATGYQIEVAYTSSFTLPLAFTKADLASTTLSTAQISNFSLSNGDYYWHVRAKKADGTWGLWSSTDRFTVAIP